jgi:hypothetical protein
MKTHEEIDQRSLALARAVAVEIDRDPERRGLLRARKTCARWLNDTPAPVLAEWLVILNQEWDQVRAVLLDEHEEGRRLRQSSPFCGILSPKKRWDIYRRFSADLSAIALATAEGGSVSGVNHESKTA